MIPFWLAKRDTLSISFIYSHPLCYCVCHTLGVAMYKYPKLYGSVLKETHGFKFFVLLLENGSLTGNQTG